MSHSPASDLLGAALLALPEPALLTGYRLLAARLAMNLPQGHRARLAPLPAGAGLLIESDLPDWLSIESPLPDDARSACVTLALRAGRPLAADLFLRVQDGTGRLIDGPVARLTLDGEAPAEALLSAPHAEGPARAVILLRAPPAELALATLRLY